MEVLHDTPLPEGTNLLLLVDQFEEIFRYRQQGDSDEADAFVALLLATAEQHEVPVYVVMTMRSDFLGDCAVFHGLPEAINAGQFLTPRLTREQRREAIVGPAMVFGGQVEPGAGQSFAQRHRRRVRSITPPATCAHAHVDTRL